MRVKMMKIRASKGFTQTSFSKLVGCSRSHYSQVENGDKYPSLRLAIKIKNALGYSTDDLFDNTTPGRH